MARLPPGNPDSRASATIASSGGGDPPKRPNHNKGGSGMGHYNERYRVGKTYKSTDRHAGGYVGQTNRNKSIIEGQEKDLSNTRAERDAAHEDLDTAQDEIKTLKAKVDDRDRKIDNLERENGALRNHAEEMARRLRHGPPVIHPDRRHRISAIRLVNSNSLTNPKFRNNIRQP
ncbi:hypothetical protein DBV05_g92 [Lasiodiplodia theobromae]|uniref:Uncharacterized protein n=1 Tax=Lasiodiplodia theobromae TaxID=45133 RepID=A0A5N5DTD5_9PEZI|nr:hypothetical protein DBV05_g92 [Lasiodiplodia theobromae]